MPVAPRYDVVVIGGGHNGLVAASYLAGAGRTVLLLERAAQLGGATASARPFPGVDVTLSRYSYLVSLLPASIVRELGLQVRLLRRRIASYTPWGEGGLLVDDGDEARTRASFRAVTGGEGEHVAWRELQAATRRLAGAVFPTLTEPLRPVEEIERLVGDRELWRELIEEPIGASIARRFEHDAVRGLVATDALIGTFADPMSDLRANRCFLYHVIGGGDGAWLVPQGGMGELAAQLQRCARRAGARLLCRAEAIAVRPGESSVEVSFVQDDREHTVRAGHALAAIAPAALARLLGEAVVSPPQGAQLKVNMVLERLPAMRDPVVSAQDALAGTLHVDESLSRLLAAHAAAAAGTLPDPIPCEVYCHSLTDPSILGTRERAAGMHTLTCFALQLPAPLLATPGVGERALEATLDALDRVFAEPLRECLARDRDGAPCLEAAAPHELERELAMPGGNIFHGDLAWPWAASADQVGRWGVETSHERVLLCGAGAIRGGGVSGIPGRNAAAAVLGWGR